MVKRVKDAYWPNSTDNRSKEFFPLKGKKGKIVGFHLGSKEVLLKEVLNDCHLSRLAGFIVLVYC